MNDIVIIIIVIAAGIASLIAFIAALTPFLKNIPPESAEKKKIIGNRRL
jgi:hypothetical protein